MIECEPVGRDREAATAGGLPLGQGQRQRHHPLLRVVDEDLTGILRLLALERGGQRHDRFHSQPAVGMAPQRFRQSVSRPDLGPFAGLMRDGVGQQDDAIPRQEDDLSIDLQATGQRRDDLQVGRFLVRFPAGNAPRSLHLERSSALRGPPLPGAIHQQPIPHRDLQMGNGVAVFKQHSDRVPPPAGADDRDGRRRIVQIPRQ